MTDNNDDAWWPPPPDNDPASRSRRPYRLTSNPQSHCVLCTTAVGLFTVCRWLLNRIGFGAKPQDRRDVPRR